MPTLKAYENGLSVGCAGSGGKREKKRGRNGGWSPGATRRNRQFLQSIDCDELDGDGYAFTLTVREIPASAEDYAAAHLHGSIYFPQGWTPAGSPITDIMSCCTIGVPPTAV